MKKHWSDVGWIILVASFIMLFRLGSIPLLDPDEPVYAQTAWEMLKNNDFISPRIYGEYWYDKPPMYYWLTAGSIALLGNTEFAARFPSALLAIITAVLVYFAGVKLLGRRAGLFAAMILTTSVEFFYLGKAAVTDITLTLFFTAALVSYSQGRYYWLYIFMGLAVLTKGPVGIVLPGLIIGLHLLWTKQVGQIKCMKIFSGLTIVLLVAGPWYLCMYQLHGMDFINIFLGFHNITRFLQPEHASGAKLYYYLPVLFIGFFPWGAYLLQAVWAGFKNRQTANGKFLALLLVWSGVVLIFFSVSQTKLISYILPMYPALALLVGWYIDRVIREKQKLGMYWGNFSLGIGVFSLVLALIILSKKYYGIVLPGVKYIAVIWAMMVVISSCAYYKEKFIIYWSSIVGGMLLFVMVLMNSIFPVAAELISVKESANIFTQAYNNRAAKVYVDKFYRPGFCYYTGMAGEMLGERFSQLLGQDEAAYFFIKEDKYFDLTNKAKGDLIVLKHQANMMLLYKEQGISVPTILSGRD